MFNEENKGSLRFSSFSFLARFGILCLPQGRVPLVLAVFSFALFKLQTLSISLLFMTKYLEDITFSATFVAEKISNAFLFGELIDSTTSSEVLKLVFTLVQLYTLVILLFVVYLLIKTYIEARIAGWVKFTWSYLVYLHMWILGTPIINFNFAVIKNITEGNINSDISSEAKTIMAIFAGVANFFNMGILFFVIYFTSVPLKNKDPLSMKSKLHMGMEISENIFLYIIYIFLTDSKSKIWILLTFNAIYTGLRVYKLYETLPYFKIVWLKLEVAMTSIISTLTFLNIIGWLFKGNYMHIPQRFLLVFWVLLIPPVAKSSVTALDKILLTILSGGINHTPTKLFHIVYILKYFLRRRVKTAQNFKRQNPHEIILLGKANITKIYNEDDDEEENLESKRVKFDWENAEHMKTFIDNHFYRISEKYPKSIPIKLMKMWSRFKYQQSYLEVANMILQMKQDPMISISTEISLLNVRMRLEEEMKFKADQVSTQNHLDMKRFIIMQDDTDKLQNLMIKQADLQKRFWLLYSQQKLEFQKLYDFSEKIRKVKRDIEAFWKNLEAYNNKKYLIPYLLYGMYLENLNNNPSQSDQFIRQNVWALIKINNQLLMNVLNEDTLYQSESTQIIVSSNKDTLGIVKNISNSFTTFFGYTRASLIGINLDILMTSFYRESHRFYLLRYFNTGNVKILDSTRKVFVKHQKGHILPILLHVKQNPFLENGLNFIAIMRPIHESGDYLVIRSNGDIDGATDRISHVLCLDHDTVQSIFDFSHYARPLLGVFNRKAFKRAKDTLVKKAYSISDEKGFRYSPTIRLSNNNEGDQSLREQQPSESFRGRKGPVFVRHVAEQTADISSSRKFLEQTARSASMLIVNSARKQLSNNNIPEEMVPRRRRDHHATLITDQYISKIDPKDQDHIHKIFSEIGAEFTFYSNDEQKSKVTCLLRVEIEIHDDSWVLIFRIDNLQAGQQTFSQEDLHNTSYDPRNEHSIRQNSGKNQEINALGILEGMYSHDDVHESERKNSNMYGRKGTTIFGPQDTLNSNRESEVKSKPHGSSLHQRNRTMSEGMNSSRPTLNMVHGVKVGIRKDEETLGNDFPTIQEENDARKARIYAFMPDYDDEDSYDLTIEQTSSFEAEKNGRMPAMRSAKKEETKYYTVEVDPNYQLSELHEPSSSKKHKNLAIAKDLVHKFRQNYETSSVASSRTTKNRTDKLIEECIDQVHVQPHFNYFTLAFLVTIVLLESLIISQAAYASNSYTQIKNKGDIVIAAYIRADNMDLTNWAARLMNVAINNLFGDKSEEIYPETVDLLKLYADAMLSKNIELEKAIGGIEVTLQQEFFTKGVRMYDLNSTGLTGTYEDMDTFGAINKIYSIVLNILSEPKPVFPSKNLQLDYLIYNSLDSLALECERAVELTSSLMSKTISDFLSQMQLLTGVSISILLLCIIASIFIILKLNRNALRMWMYFTSISEEDVDYNLKHINKFITGISKDIQNKDHPDVQVVKKVRLAKSEKSARNFALQYDSKQVSFTWYYISNAWLVFKLWPVLILLGATTLVNYTNSSNGVEKMKQMQAQIINVVYYMYITDIGFISLIDIVLHNGTTTTRGQPVLEEVKRITKYGGNNQEYVVPFRNTDGSFASYQYDLIFGTSCNNTDILTDQSFVELCTQLSGGTGKMGLLQTNPIYEKTMQEFADAWMQSPMSPELIPEFMQRYYYYVTQVNYLQNFYIMALQGVTNEAFFNYIANERSNFVELVGVCCAVAAVMAYLSYRFVLLKVRGKDFRLKCFVKLVNVKLILKNRWLKNYLTDNTDKLGEALKKL